MVGNPPYVSNWNLTESDPNLVSAIGNLYNDVAVGHWDLYVPFCYRSLNLLAEGGRHSFVVSNAIAGEKYARNLRQHMVDEYTIDSLVTFDSDKVFKNVSRMVLVYVAENTPPSENNISLITSTEEQFNSNGVVPQNQFSEFSDYSWRFDLTTRDLELKEKLEQIGIELGHLCLVNPGVVAHSAADSPLDFDKSDVIIDTYKKGSKKFVGGRNVARHNISWGGKYIEYDKYREHFHRPKNPLLFESPKIMFTDVSGQGNRIKSCYDDSGYYTNHTVNHATKWTDEKLKFKSPSDYDVHEDAAKYDLQYIAGVVNSSVLSYYFSNFLATKSLQTGRTRMHPQEIRSLPIAKLNGQKNSVDNSLQGSMEKTAKFVGKIMKLKAEKSNLNLNPIDYLTNSPDGPTLTDIGFTQPPKNAAESILQQTTKQKPNLRVGRAEIHRESSSTVEVRLTARYKPDDETTGETDRWGYTETEPLPALRITDLSPAEADMIEAFVPVAVDEAGGFAGFRETATKTNSLVDRLHGLTLPRLADVRDSLENYIETRERAEKLEEEIERTDDMIDEIVYELYGLTDEEIKIVEKAVEK